jgi:uncharacterized membrane protein
MALQAYLRALGIGAVAGLRTFTAPAATLAAGRQVWGGLAIVAAAGELFADKLSFTPSRLSPPALGARLVSGALCGGALADRFEGSRAVGSVLGAAAAGGSAWLGYTIRHKLTEMGMADFPIAVVEDAVAIFTAKSAVTAADEL